jgi:tetratricopeptide (TPR) repeat protein
VGPADAGAAQPHIALAQMFTAAGMADSAVIVMDRALARPDLRSRGLLLHASALQLLADDPRAFGTAQEALAGATPAELQRLSVSDRAQGMSAATSVAAAAGNVGEARRALDLFAAADSGAAPSPIPPRESLEYFLIGIRLALGEPPAPATLDTLRRGLDAVGALGGAGAAALRGSVASVAYVAFLTTGDTSFSQAVRGLSAPGLTHTDLDALEALQRGDTAAARAIARGFTSPDSLRIARLSLGGMRAAARAEVLAAVGDLDRAIGYYEALDPARISFNTIEPGVAVYTRTYAARARLYEERGERDKAVAAWEEYLRRTEQGDDAVRTERAAAQAALRRLRERAP